MVMTGLSEDPDEIDETDGEKVIKVLEAAGCPDPTHTVDWVMKRMGQANDRR